MSTTRFRAPVARIHPETAETRATEGADRCFCTARRLCWRAINIATWGMCLFLGGWAAILIPFQIILVPLFLPGAIGAISYTSAQASRVCSGCERRRGYIQSALG